MRVVTIAGLFMLAVACSGGDEGRGKQGRGGGDWGKRPEPVTVVEVEQASLGDVSDRLLANATVESEKQAGIFPQATGRVVSVHVDEGDPVDKGTLLAVLDNVTLDASAERASSDLQRLEEQYERLKSLYEKGAVSKRELDDARYSLSTARTSAREASRSYGQTRLTAPFEGVVAARDIRVGELATSAQQTFFIVDLDDLRVVASLPERDLQRVRVGQQARLISAYDDEIWSDGTVERIAPIIDATSGTFRVTIVLDEGQTALRPGQFVSVELEVDRHEDVLTVPRRALVYEDGRPVVYTMIPEPEKEPEDGEEKKGQADKPEAAGGGWWPWGGSSEEKEGDKDEEKEDEERFVADRALLEVGLIDDERVEVVSGVEEGDRIVVLGQSNLKDGARIRVPRDNDEEASEESTEAAMAADDEDAEDG